LTRLWKPATGVALEARRLASPIRHITAKTRLILILHSDNDGSVPVQQARDMAAALEKAKAPHRISIYKNQGHMRVTPDVIKETRAQTAHANQGEESMRFELNRYLGWPGQAPAYKIGERLWLQLRDEVAHREGDAFSLKDFHRRSLDLGSVGLDVMRDAVLA